MRTLKVATNKKEYMKEYRLKNKARIDRQVKEYYEKNKDAIKEYKRKHWANRDEETKKRKAQFNKDWKKNNIDKVNSLTAIRRGAKLNRTPGWLTKEQKRDMRRMYALAKKFEKLFGLKYHVDHIVPLQGSNISGLHVPWNLQIMVSTLNESKGNSYEFD